MQTGQIVAHGHRRTGNTVTDTLQLREVMRIDFLQNEIHVCPPPKIVDGVTPARIGGICDHLCLVVVFSNNDVPGDTNTWQRPVVTFQLFPLLSVTLTDRARSRAGPQRYNVDGAWRRPG